MTIFGKIISGEIPTEKIFENEHVIAIKDISPKANIHLLIIPKKEIPNLQSLGEEDLFLMQEVVRVAQKLAKDFGIEDGYRLVTNCGKNAGQEVFHLHFHLLGGNPLKGIG